jgi:hypothetical protein
MCRRLRVSPVFLVHTSPVFKALLGFHFKEGNALAASSSVEIPMPDDDSAAMKSSASFFTTKTYHRQLTRTACALLQHVATNTPCSSP